MELWILYIKNKKKIIKKNSSEWIKANIVPPHIATEMNRGPDRKWLPVQRRSPTHFAPTFTVALWNEAWGFEFYREERVSGQSNTWMV